PLSEEQLIALGRQAGADMVLTGQILDYGAVQRKYWITGLVVHSVAGLLVVGFATGWHPAAIGAYALYETPDVFIWGGGAYVLGWAFRPESRAGHQCRDGTCRRRAPATSLYGRRETC